MLAPVLVQQAEHPPHRCILTGLIDGPFVDASIQIEAVPMQGTRAYFHPTAIHQLASEIGMVTKEEHQKALQRAEEAELRLRDAEDQLRETDIALDAVDALTKRGLVVRKQPGRKPKKEPQNV